MTKKSNSGIITNAKNIKQNKQTNYSAEYKKYLKKVRLHKTSIIFSQLFLLVAIFALWESLAHFELINTFFLSSPSRIIKTLIEYDFLLSDVIVTLKEAILAFFIATGLGCIIAIFLWWNSFLRKVLDPYIVVLNSLPKIALGPIIILIAGIGSTAIITMAILIMIFITILSMLHNFITCEQNKVLLLKSMNASKFQILTKLILPNALPEFLSILKINVGLTWVGTIMGEYLVSKAGLGYQIIYGGQTFKLDLIMTSTVLLCILAAVMYFIVAYIEKRVNNSYRK